MKLNSIATRMSPCGRGLSSPADAPVSPRGRIDHRKVFEYPWTAPQSFDDVTKLLHNRHLSYIDIAAESCHAMNPIVTAVTQRIRNRSAKTREAYLARVEQGINRPRGSDRMGCANVAHAFAAMPSDDKLRIVADRAPNIGIVTAYNDMLSAHQQYEGYPSLIREEAHKQGATAQVAGGTPAMCDGVTQGLPGMEMSLFSRDTIAMSTAIALTHDVFDAALLLGICDKIVPGLLIGALHFGLSLLRRRPRRIHHRPCVGRSGRSVRARRNAGRSRALSAGRANHHGRSRS